MKMYRIAAGASAAVLVLGLMTACGKKQEPVVEEEPIVQENTLEEAVPAPEETPVVEFPLEEQESSDAEEEVQPAEHTVRVAELTEIAEDGSMNVLPFMPVDETSVIEDYLHVDFETFAAGEQNETLELSENAVFHLIVDGEAVEADREALVVGAMLVIVTDAEGVQNVMIHTPAAEEAA